MEEVMTRPQRKNLYSSAIRKWGINSQLGMLMEECAELIQATHKCVRKGSVNKEVWDNLAEEMADVEIMIEQIKLGMDWHLLEPKVREIKEKKLKRLEGWIQQDS
jgi:NTP pyrophosphatase (non-canonical NTP hydrolase)